MVSLSYEQYRDSLLAALGSAFDNHFIDYYETEDILQFIRWWSPEGGYQPPVVSPPEPPPSKAWERW